MPPLCQFPNHLLLKINSNFMILIQLLAGYLQLRNYAPDHLAKKVMVQQKLPDDCVALHPRY